MPAPEENTEQKLEQQNFKEIPAREITQTDHLNKKLLTSLFNRMDQGGDSILDKMLEQDNIDEESDEWKE